MRVTLSPELFTPPMQHTLLVALLRYPLDERHRIELDVTHPAVASWLVSQAPGLREEIQTALELSARGEVLEPSHTSVVVVRTGPSAYHANPPRVALDDARRFLDEPFAIVLEDARSDRAFLERMMTDEERRFLAQRIKKGFVRVDHGGGIDVMARRMKEEAEDPENRHRRWVLFDSDAMRPGAPSTASNRLRAACQDIAHHQLQRRYAESYLPHRSLHGWAANVSRRPERNQRLRLFEAFVAMTADQRHHYNMKDGFDGDAGRTDASAGDLYADLPRGAQQALAHGFGSYIAQLFDDQSVTEADLRRDTGWDELRPSIGQLLARMR